MPWQVDVRNGPRRVIVSISVDLGSPSGVTDCGGLWFVDPEAQVTLFECPEAARPGGIEIIEVTDSGCALLDKAQFDAGDFTIVLSGLRSGPYTLRLTPGAALTGPPGAERTTDCMG